jgi:aspartyl/glutamyl-tRNA(Asn/Gln) amidotransferase C subunit
MVSAEFPIEKTEKLAEMCAIPLSEGEKVQLSQMFGDTLEYIDVLDELDTSKTKATYQVNGLSNVYRDSEKACATLTQQQTLSNAKEVVVNKITTSAVFDR